MMIQDSSGLVMLEDVLEDVIKHPQVDASNPLNGNTFLAGTLLIFLLLRAAAATLLPGGSLAAGDEGAGAASKSEGSFSLTTVLQQVIFLVL